MPTIQQLRGGARPNSGRPKKANGVLYVRMPQDIIDAIKQRAAYQRKTLGDYLQDALSL